MYKLKKDPASGIVGVVQKQEGKMLYSIPFDPANTDYQAYLAWLAEGNTPLPAEANTPTTSS
jgi:hypothetical protein